MLLDNDINILDDFEKLITSKPTRENLETCGCICVKECYDHEDWIVIYKGIRKKFSRSKQVSVNDPYILKIYCKHYTNAEKTAWVSYGSEYAKNVKEILDWIDAEIDFYKDHPEEKEGTSEYECKRQRDLLIGEKLNSLRWEYNKSLSRYKTGFKAFGYGLDTDDEIWYALYFEAYKQTKLEHPELFV